MDVVRLLDQAVREDGQQVSALLGEEGRGAFLGVGQEDRVAAEVGQVGVEGDATAPADLVVDEVQVPGGVGEAGVEVAFLGGEVQAA